MISTETIGLTISFAKENITFRQRVISVAEENRFRQRFLALSETEKEEKGYDFNVSVLAQFAAEDVELTTFDESGEDVKTRLSVNDYFINRTVVKERIADYAMRSFFAALSPKVDFF